MTTTPETKTLDYEALATHLVDKELKDLRKTFIYFAEEALQDPENIEQGGVDVRIVMEKVLAGLLSNHGRESSSTICDTAPRDQILEKVTEAIDTYANSFDDQLLKAILHDDPDFPNYRKLEEKGDNSVNWIIDISTEYMRIKNIPVTRMYESENLDHIVKFIKDVINRYFDRFCDEKTDVEELLSIIRKEASR